MWHMKKGQVLKIWASECLDGRNCPTPKTAKKSGFRHPTFLAKMTSKRPKPVLGVGNPTPMTLKTPFWGPFWKLVLVHLEDIMGMGDEHFQPRSRSFWRFNERCVRQNHLELLAPVSFLSFRHTFKDNPTRTLLGLTFWSRVLDGVHVKSHDTCVPKGVGLPIPSVSV